MTDTKTLAEQIEKAESELEKMRELGRIIDFYDPPKKTLADLLALPAGAELDAAVANALSDDLKARDEDLFENVRGMMPPELRKRLFDLRFGIYRGLPDATEGGFYFWLWQTREGEPYAAALEAAVAAYRRPAPPYSQDTPEGWWAMRAMFVELHRRRFEVNHIQEEGGQFCCEIWYLDRLSVWGYAETLPLAVCRAALAALEGGERDAVDRQ